MLRYDIEPEPDQLVAVYGTRKQAREGDVDPDYYGEVIGEDGTFQTVVYVIPRSSSGLKAVDKRKIRVPDGTGQLSN